MGQLFDRIYGCEAASTIGNAMGDPVEGMSWEAIESKHGFLQEFLAQDKQDRVRPQPFGTDWRYHAHHRPPGATEDGMERHKLCASAVIRKGGRITVEDLAEQWLKDIDPDQFGYLLGPQDRDSIGRA